MKKLYSLLLTLLSFYFSFAEANYVYHETTTNTIGTGSLQYREVMIPNRTQSVKIGFKIEFETYWNQARIYYTTDGSNPSGSFGIGNGTTQVINTVWDHKFGSPVVDAVYGIIPSQPAGTTVKYIVSAWHSGGGDEIFGNGCGNCINEKRPSSNADVFSYNVSTTSRKMFTSDINPAVSINNSNGSCTTSGLSSPNVFNISVSGVGNMTSINQLVLVSVALNDCGTGSKNLNLTQFRLMSPSGQCYGLYSGGLSSVATGTHYLNLVSSTTCLTDPNTSNANSTGSSFFGTGNNGYFNAQFNGTPTYYSNYTGNADGTWKLIFSETTSSPPCLDLIRLVFDDPNVINQTTQGDNCSNPIVWDGRSQICGTTTSSTQSSQMPGWNSGSIVNSIGGVNCQWNSLNHGDVWIKFVATQTTSCLSLNGVSGTNISAQSIVVTDANIDNDNNPCTQVAKTSTNDPNWIVVSCPRNQIYGTSAGSKNNQQHCFTSEVGKAYYMVVDSDGFSNPISKFWMWGFGYDGTLPLGTYNPIVFIRDQKRSSVTLTNGILKTEIENNTVVTQRIMIYDASSKLLFDKKATVKTISEIDIKNYMSNGINFIKVILENKKNEVFILKCLK